MADLHLNVKVVYFEQIRDRSKPKEYRLCTPYWIKRLSGRSFDRIFVKRAYPPAGDVASILERPWRGYVIETITHPHFGPEPVLVFGIFVN